MMTNQKMEIERQTSLDEMEMERIQTMEWVYRRVAIGTWLSYIVWEVSTGLDMCKISDH
jgi:hypothetical protein